MIWKESLLHFWFEVIQSGAKFNVFFNASLFTFLLHFSQVILNES